MTARLWGVFGLAQDNITMHFIVIACFSFFFFAFVWFINLMSLCKIVLYLKEDFELSYDYLFLPKLFTDYTILS